LAEVAEEGGIRRRKAEAQRARKVSAAYLERAALHYLGRFASTEANLRKVLERKVRRRNEDGAAPSAEQQGWIDTVAAKCVRYGYVDDAAYARNRVEALVRKGKPVRMIAQDLRHKGVPEDIGRAALQAFGDAHDDVETDEKAAAAYAKRRRFGPFRRADRDTPEKREKEKAAMMRAGFSYRLTQETLAASEEELLARMD
jgi:regulatory protein